MLPFLLGGAALLTGLVGVEAHKDAKETNERAQRRIREADALYKDAKEYMESAERHRDSILEKFAREKNDVLQNSMAKFMVTYSKIRPAALDMSYNDDNLSKYTINDSDMKQLKELSSIYRTAVAGGATGALIGLAVTSAVPLLGTIAAGALASLGGLGVIGGAAVIGSRVPGLGALMGPVALFTGAAAGVAADENLEKAGTYYAKCEAKAEEMNVYKAKCRGIADIANELNDTLIKLDKMFSICVDKLYQTVDENLAMYGGERVDPYTLSADGQNLLAVTRSLAGAVKAVIVTDLIKDDRINNEAKNVYNEQNQLLPEFTAKVDKVQEASMYNKQPQVSKKQVQVSNSVQKTDNRYGRTAKNGSDVESLCSGVSLYTNGFWSLQRCRLAAYLIDENNTAKTMWKNINENCEVEFQPGYFTNIIFCAIPRDVQQNSFANAVARTVSIKLPNYNSATYKLTGKGEQYIGEWVDVANRSVTTTNEPRFAQEIFDKINTFVKQVTETYGQSLGSKPGVMKISLDTSGLWPEAVCRYAAYYFSDKCGKIEWKNINSDSIPVDSNQFTHVIFCAMQKEGQNDWENVLFQTVDIKLPQFAKAEFKLTGMDTNQGNKFVGKWINTQSFMVEPPKKEDKVMTFNSAGLWPEAICRYAAYFTDKNNSAHSIWRDVEADGKVVIPEDGYTDVIFCGLTKNEKKNSFANAIFRTGNIELPKRSGATYKLINVDVSDNNKFVGEWQSESIASPPQKK